MKSKVEPRFAKHVIRMQNPGCRGKGLIGLWTRWREVGAALRAMLLLVSWCLGAAEVQIEKVEPTPLFPQPAPGQPLRQLARLHLNNVGQPLEGRARIQMGDAASYLEDLGSLGTGKSTNEIHLTEISVPTKVSIEILRKDSGQSLAKLDVDWQPQKKWNIHCISYSHHDLGFGNYPHRLRTEIRHANIERPLQYCAETDGWDEDSQFRFVIETSEPITSFLGSHSASQAADLALRIRQGRIQVGGVLATVNTEQLGHELMARLFYLSGRHTPDLLGVPSGRTALIDDVIGLSWPFATALKEAGISYLFHGYNGCGHCLKPAESEPVFFWQGPDRDPRPPVLARSVAYGGYAGDSLGDGSPARIENAIRTLGAQWPYDTLLLQDGTDFQLVTRDNADRIRSWNSRYRYPHLVCATLDMFFSAIAAQANPAQIKTFAKDGNNQWADQDATDAWLLGHARRLGEALPTVEKLATLSAVLAGGSYPWTDLYQAYHRLLLYHEHTDAIDAIAPQRERMRQYETELVENREMVLEGEEFTTRALESSLDKLANLITTKSERNLIVMNPLPRARTDLVRFRPTGLNFQIIDDSTGGRVPHQVLPDGDCLFVARKVPATGYKTFSLVPASAVAKPVPAGKENQMENGFYRLTFNPRTGALASIWDKQLKRELVDTTAPHQFNEYLYERFEKPTLQDTSVWYRVESAKLSSIRGPVADVMTIRAQATGVESLTQQIVLYHALKRIDFVMDVVKSPSGRNSRMRNTSMVNKESLFVALPFSVPEYRFHHELPGGVAEPIRDQFDGSCTAYYAVRHFTDVSNDRFGVTIAPLENSLVEYGYPRSCPIVGGREHEFEREMRYPTSSRVYLYLLDNMFDVNIRWDQPGPIRFSWSMRSHAGNWQQGRADEFGWDTHNPLLVRMSPGAKTAPLPASRSFLTVDVPNVACTTFKPAEANGAGYILRFSETQGKSTSATVTLGFLDDVSAATETDLVENDRPRPLPVRNRNKVNFSIPPFGLKTIRVVCTPMGSPASLQGLTATPLSDMQIRLAWQPQSQFSQYRVYRGDTQDFTPSLLHLVARCSSPEWVDQPQLQYGGWINNRLEPNTKYYYRVAGVDRANNEGPLSPVVATATLDASAQNLAPLRVEGLRAILVSPIAPFNFVNLLFRTSCESDVQTYEIHRSTQHGFQPDEKTCIGKVKADSVIPGSTAYGHVPIDYRAGDYDHLMYEDDQIQPFTSYFYRVCAVDRLWQKGPFSAEASVRTGAPPPPPVKATASSVYAPEYPAVGAFDGDTDPYTGWISKPFGGGSREAPTDVWLSVELPRPLKLKGVVYCGDDRPVIPILKGFQIQARQGDRWVTVGSVAGASSRVVTLQWPEVVETGSLRFLVPAKDLPLDDPAGGVARVCELKLILSDGAEVFLPDLK